MEIPSITSDPSLINLSECLPSRGKVVHATGLWGSSTALVGAYMARRSSRFVLYVTAHLEEADDVRDDLELFGADRVELLPAWETLRGEGPGAGEIQAERVRLCAWLASLRTATEKSTDAIVVVAPIQALMQPLPAPRTLQENTLRLSVGAVAPQPQSASPDALVRWAVDRGLTRLDLVESPGDVAKRGDIVDLFMPGENFPCRVQYFGEEVESIRRFEPTSQRSIENLRELSITALPPQTTADDERCLLPAYLPHNALVFLDEPAIVQEMGQTIENRLETSRDLYDVGTVLAELGRFAQVHLARFGGAPTSDEPVFDLRVTSLTRFEGESEDRIAELCRAAADHTAYVVCDNEGERQRLLEMLRGYAAPHVQDRIHTVIGILHHGFEWTTTRTIVVSHHELFHRHRQRRRVRKMYAGSPVDSWTDLIAGEHVVHVTHGIAVYRGLTKLRKGDSQQQEEFLTLEFADNAVVQVPTSQVDLVQKYIGAGGHKPKLSTLGGRRWGKTKEQVAKAVSELAESLLKVQAMREVAEGTAYPSDTKWQREFEAAFPYEETEDQLGVASEIRGDLLRARPMDRLVCGDVGYGKTELAMRAAFKVAEYGRQVAVLVPTTVLAEQHFETFRERFADYPFSIASLSRFRTGAEQRRIIEDLKKGRIDLVVGTHRLLSKDVSFANLGLVIIDEEQRFGVEHKERLKSLRATVDVLTLTATPIPRTLHMAMVGVRDISSLQTPPVDRRSIATQVRPFDRELVRDAILRELNRDGQVFFVHNFVQSIASMADTVHSIVPEARVVYGHGQMHDDELEEVMHRFLRREADVLVSTTIIESGIDIPSANTIFINRAERFGLADLHQLRGRVGRSHHRAYCYLLLSPDRPPTSKAAKRLKTIEEFSELGAGFRIAMRDLEIRGAGNLIGKEQSGHIAAVGYDMYCRLLEQAARRLKNEPDVQLAPVQLDLDVSANLPKQYISSERSRLEVYRRIATCRTIEDLSLLECDLKDAFGPVPRPVQVLLEMAEVRVYARRFGISSISLRPPDVVFGVEHVTRAEPLFDKAPGSVRAADSKTIHWRPPPRYLEQPTLLTVLRKLLTKASVEMEIHV